MASCWRPFSTHLLRVPNIPASRASVNRRRAKELPGAEGGIHPVDLSQSSGWGGGDASGDRSTPVPAAAQEEGLDEDVAIAVQDLLHVSPLELRAMILDQGIGLQDVGADLAAEVNVLLRPLLRGPLLVPLAPLQLVQAGPENLHGHVAVAVLGALVLARSND